jgi:hypothetical protein
LNPGNHPADGLISVTLRETAASSVGATGHEHSS